MTLDEVARALRFKSKSEAARRDFLIELVRPIALLLAGPVGDKVDRYYDSLMSNPARIDPIDKGNAIFDQFKSKLK